MTSQHRITLVDGTRGGGKGGDPGASGEGQGWGRGEDLVASGKGPTKEGGGTLGPLGIKAEAS